MKFTVVKGTLIAKGRWPKSTLGAIIVSVQKWITARIFKPSNGLKSGTCGLCQIYVEATGTCAGCPVMEVTGRSGCANTPWYVAKSEIMYGRVARSFPRHINREIRFLISLLPGLGWLRWGMKQKDGSYK